VRSTRESALSLSRRMSPARNHTLEFYDEDGNFRDDLWLTYHERMKKDPNSCSHCRRRIGESPLPLNSFPCSLPQKSAQSTVKSGRKESDRELCASVTRWPHEDDDEDGDRREMSWLDPKLGPQNVTPISTSSDSIYVNGRAFSGTDAVTTAGRRHAHVDGFRWRYERTSSSRGLIKI
jgi:hypothetical protein